MDTHLIGAIPGLLMRGCPAYYIENGGRVLVLHVGHHPEEPVSVYDGAADSRVQVPASKLALDLSESAGMDRAARWLAARVGLDVGATAPAWQRVSRGDDEGVWALGAWDLDHDTGWPRRQSLAAFHGGHACAPRYRPVPGISTVTDPAVALRLAVLAAGKGGAS